jgi:hypothetical protein
MEELKNELEMILVESANYEKALHETGKEISKLRLEYILKFIRNTEGWNLARYNPRCSHIVIGNTFPAEIKLSCFTEKYKEVSVRLSANYEEKTNRITIEGGVADIERICLLQLGLKMKKGEVNKWFRDLGVIGYHGYCS